MNFMGRKIAMEWLEKQGFHRGMEASNRNIWYHEDGRKAEVLTNIGSTGTTVHVSRWRQSCVEL